MSIKCNGTTQSGQLCQNKVTSKKPNCGQCKNPMPNNGGGTITRETLKGTPSAYRAGGFNITNIQKEMIPTVLTSESVSNMFAKKDLSKRTRKDMKEALTQIEETVSKMEQGKPVILEDNNGNKIASYSPKKQLRVNRDLIPEDAYEFEKVTSWARVDNAKVEGDITLGNADVNSIFASDGELEEWAVISQKGAAEVFGEDVLKETLEELDKEAGDTITIEAPNPQRIQNLFDEEADYRKKVVANFESGIADLSDLEAIAGKGADDANVLFANGKPIAAKVTYERRKVNWSKVVEGNDGELLDKYDLGGIYDMQMYPSKRHKNK